MKKPDKLEPIFPYFPALIKTCPEVQDHRKLTDLFMKSHIFLLEQAAFIEKDATPIAATHVEMVTSTPFEHCYFECIDGDLGRVINGATNDQMSIVSLLTEELVPGVLSVAALMSFNGTLLSMYQDIYGADEDTYHYLHTKIGKRDPKTLSELIPLHNGISTILSNIYSLLQTSDLGVELPHRHVKLPKTPYGNISHKFHSIIRVRAKVKSAESVKPVIGKKIEWSQHWWTRGHWRRLEKPTSIGKNRQGKYHVAGFTWVTEHMKGNLEGPLRKHTYVVEANKLASVNQTDMKK